MTFSSGGTICIDTTLVTSPVTVTSANLFYLGLGPITINGNGATIQGNGNFGLIIDDSTGLLSIHDLTITGGHYSDPVFASGAAINAGGNVTVTKSTFTNNTATATGNSTPDAVGGAIAAVGSVTIIDSTFSNNTVTACCLSATAINGAIHSAGSLTVTGSTFTNNTATVSGLGGQAGGGAIGANINELVLVTNSTLTGNTVTASDPAFASGGAIRGNDITLVYATLVSNTAPRGANVDLVGGAFGDGLLTSFGSVLALPQGGGTSCADLQTISKGWNFSDDTSCAFTNTTSGDRENAGAPGLGALADNGGPTQTRLPEAGSPLVDAIPVPSCHTDLAPGVATDQRGVSRPRGSGCDIGAVETGTTTPSTTPPVTTPSTIVPIVARFAG